MAEEILRSRHAFGNIENLQAAIDAKLIDEHDILFLKDIDGKARIGWIDKDGNVVLVTDEKADLSQVEADVDALELNVDALENEMAKKADVETVNAELDDLNADIAACENTHLKVKYEVSDVPTGTLINYREDEIRIMCPKDTVFTKQSVGAGGNPNSYYMTFKTYYPSKDVVGYIEHLGDLSDAEILTKSSTDKYGRVYQSTWLALADYDATTESWTYRGKESSKDGYYGYDYQIDWYDANGVMVDSDSIRINLSNEDCHYTSEPYYVASANAEIVEEAVEVSKTYTDKQVAIIQEAIAVVEF